MADVFTGEVVDSTPGQETGLARVTMDDNPEATIAILEKKAQLSARWAQAINTILVTQTVPEDWSEQGGKMCLSSAGAERIGRMFPIRFGQAKYEKQEFEDKYGRGFRFICTCDVTMNDRTVPAQGSYSTRDKFLGYAHGEWKDPSDVNEGYIRNAAYHICIGNGIKAILGIRNLPKSEYVRIMAAAGHNPGQATTVQRGQGNQGGTSGDDRAKQQELVAICLYIADAGLTVEPDGQDYRVIPISDGDDRDRIERAKEICCILSSFKGKDGKVVNGKGASELHGQRLNVTLDKARKIKAMLDGDADAN